VVFAQQKDDAYMPPASKTHRRRWFQFGLGTMFLLVTVFALGLKWEMNAVHRRTALRDWLEQNGGWTYEKGSGITARTCARCIYVSGVPKDAAPSIPPWRRSLGDRPLFFVVLPIGHTQGDFERARDTFPELRAIYQVVPDPEVER
jgi:hypothetical protein